MGVFCLREAGLLASKTKDCLIKMDFKAHKSTIERLKRKKTG